MGFTVQGTGAGFRAGCCSFFVIDACSGDAAEDVFQLESGIVTEFFYRNKLLGRPAEVLLYLAEVEPRLLVGLSGDVLYVFRVDAGPVVRFHGFGLFAFAKLCISDGVFSQAVHKL